MERALSCQFQDFGAINEARGGFIRDRHLAHRQVGKDNQVAAIIEGNRSKRNVAPTDRGPDLGGTRPSRARRCHPLHRRKANGFVGLQSLQNAKPGGVPFSQPASEGFRFGLIAEFQQMSAV
ncbi:hypothetical protein [Jannaschia faecimaris]|uniref:hypothetical protein n=1 Tax=Jannaschia faecimaris TaxID=1244108 RepID=UPI000B8088D6|nr:hypothetical protein [Jannaschia faecimaris]